MYKRRNRTNECRIFALTRKFLIQNVLLKEMKRIVTIGILAACIAGCTSPNLVTKPWHVSAGWRASPISSTLYPYVEWSTIQELRVGMSAQEAETLVHDLQYYHHPMNAIVFSEYRGEEFEVALKLSKDKETIEDISYKRRN
jgi:hypothetical protein